ncbi:hypothetical protein [Acinetobacter pittii]|uniref:Uncharacterized protein n=1 Tax=Acinetobacter pittii TaxID=48296 RepID=A0A6H0G0C3_ACIPI|nr:hypothetical protein [Acinetobacter pittii]QIT19998.1 hypothetical protein G8E09_19505 [Acinetobacter pittii]
MYSERKQKTGHSGNFNQLKQIEKLNSNHVMTTNETFKFLLNLTGLKVDLDTLEKMMKPYGYDFTRSRVNNWTRALDRPEARPMPKAHLEAFMQALFKMRNDAAEKGVDLFDLRGIYEDMENWEKPE